MRTGTWSPTAPACSLRRCRPSTCRGCSRSSKRWPRSREHCTSSTDKLLAHINGPVREFAQRLREAVDDDTRLELLTAAKLVRSYGQKNNWLSIGIDVVKGRLADLQADCEVLRRNVQEAVLQVLASSLADFTVRGAEDRRRAGELEFHDLLVLARAVLRDPEPGSR